MSRCPPLAPRLPAPHYAANKQQGGMRMRILQVLRATALSALAAAALTASARSETITVTHWGSAFYGAPYAVAMEKGFFKKRGVDITGILTSPGRAPAAVPSRGVEAAMNGEPLYSENQAKIKPVFWSKDCFPPEMTQSVGITTTEFAATGGEKLRAILAARREGVEYIIKNPDESADIV